MKNLTGLFALTMMALALAIFQGSAAIIYEPYTFTTFAGSAGNEGSADGTGRAAKFRYPTGLAVDKANNIYVADAGNGTIRKVTPAGEVTTMAGLAGAYGSSDGTGGTARFNALAAVAVDIAGNVYVAEEYNNNTIRKVTPAGVVTTLAGQPTPGVFPATIDWADGTGRTARFAHPFGVAVDSAGQIYVADTYSGTIRTMTPAGVVTTIAGEVGVTGSADGVGRAALFFEPTGMAADNQGNVYVADYQGRTIRKVTKAGAVTTLAGLARQSGYADGIGSAARFGGELSIGPPRGSSVAVDTAGNVFVTDTYNHTVRKMTPAGAVTTLAGFPTLPWPFVSTNQGSADGAGRTARFNRPRGVAVDSAGNVYVADHQNHTIRKGFPPPRILTSGQGFGFTGGQFGFDLTGPAGRSVVVETSTDLVRWLPLWTNIFAGTLHFSDPESGALSARFYRARLP